jgi:uncharacterized protein YndB with AHSA1/START domain
MTSLTLVRRIRARPQLVFDAVTTAEGIVHWWGPDAGPVLVAETDPRVGGLFRVRFLRMLDSTEYESSGEFLEIVRPERVVMSWRWKDGVPDPGESRVEITLKAVPEGTNSPSSIRNCTTRKRATAMKRGGRARSTSWKRISPREPRTTLGT